MTQSKPPIGTAPAGTDDKDPAEIAKIEADIDQTRNAISGDLRTLGERLSPQHLKEEAKEVMTEAKNVAVETLHEAKNVATSTYREVKDDAMETVSAKVDEFRDNVRSAEREALGFVRENAVPLALIGVGVAWFLSNRRSRDARWEGGYRPRDYGRWSYPEPEGRHPVDDAREGVYRAAGTTRELGHRAKERARDWVEGARHEASDRAGQVRDFAEREVHEVRGMARDAQERLGHAASRARDVAGRELRHARELSQRTTESHPLAVAAAAAAAGVCVGLLIPETQREDELFGPRRERLLGDAKGVMREAKGAVQDLTHTAKETARDVKNSLSGATS
jgi:ElaB/YqjD/DUF883 family membrane-anchored ribosome-binding protein